MGILRSCDCKRQSFCGGVVRRAQRRETAVLVVNLAPLIHTRFKNNRAQNAQTWPKCVFAKAKFFSAKINCTKTYRDSVFIVAILGNVP